MKHSTYVVCGCKSWNKRVFEEVIASYEGNWHFMSKKEELTTEALERLRPESLFFLHWSWIVPEAIVETYECINFHMTDLPYGRGGSPLQNLILRGHTTTKLTAFRMTNELDAGPVYLKKPMSLDGTAQEILERSSVLAAQMIKYIVEKQPQPAEQKGEALLFKRRQPQQSAIPSGLTQRELYDFIRMLDAEGYPAAFIQKEGFRYEFRGAVLQDDAIEASVRIFPHHAR